MNFLLGFKSICSHMTLKFRLKATQKSSISSSTERYVRSLLFLFSFTIIPFYISALEEIEKLFDHERIDQGVTVDLREPLYSDGILSTEQGGVIKGPQIRIQAQKIRYTRRTVDEASLWTIEAEGSLIIEFGEYVFTGEQLFYDFNKRSGEIIGGKTAVDPWFFGGELLKLQPDRSVHIINGYATTSERDVPDWGIYSDSIEINKEREVRATDVSFRAFHFTIMKLPILRANLSNIFDAPIRYRFRWGGRQGPRFGFTYQLFSWNHWKTFFRFDYRFTRGPGGGLETYYQSEDHKTKFQSISYLAKDSSILSPHEKARYRFEGFYKKTMDEDKTSILLTYDKISDRDMPSVYYDRDFDFDTADRTQLRIRRQEDNWVSSLYIRARVNSFQTVKQELPTIETNFKPFPIKNTGIIFENQASASYLNFEYSKYLPHVHNYSSSRLEYFPTFYRPIVFDSYCTLTPELSCSSILYNSSPKHDDQFLLQGKLGLGMQTQLYRTYGSVKHIIEPYANYRYYSSPTSPPHDHYIFDLSDGLTRLNYLSFGLNNAFYGKQTSSSSSRFLSADFYSFAFFNTRKIHQAIPRVYGRISMLPLETVRHTLDVGWNLEHQQLDFFNIRTDWTVSEDLAIYAELRHRGSYWWRKVDQENFFLDMFHKESELKHSQLSDRCNTLLLHFFYRFHPNWVWEFTSRYGWNRRHEPRYFEFECDVLTTIQTAWNLRFSYQHQQNDDRVAVFLNVGLSRPNIPREPAKKYYCFD